MGGGISVLVLGILVVFALQASLIAEAERAACSGRCAGRPTEFGQAFFWLIESFFWGVVPSGYEPATVRAKLLAGGAQAMWLTLLGCVVAAGRQARRRRGRAENQVRRDLEAAVGEAGTVVVLTATNAEGKAVRRHLTELGEPRRENGTIFDFGELPGTSRRVALAVMGHGNPPAAALAERAIHSFRPSALLIVGVAHALREGVELGDVVVADRVYGYHSGREDDDGFHARPRVIEMSHELLQLAGYLDRTDGWRKALPERSRADRCRVHIGPVAAGEQQLGSGDTVTSRRLSRHYDDAVVIETESFGSAYAGHLNGSLDVLIIRGVSASTGGVRDGGTERERQEAAAANAAAFAVAVIQNMRSENEPHR